MIVPVREIVSNEKGEALGSMLIVCMVIIFIILPVTLAVTEKYIISVKIQAIRDSLDVANDAAYTALKMDQAAQTSITADGSKLRRVFEQYLSANLNLNDDLSPKPGSIADGQVVIHSVIMYTGPFPQTDPQGKTIIRPTVYSYVTVPVKPDFYIAAVLNALGQSYIQIPVAEDTELPVNN